MRKIITALGVAMAAAGCGTTSNAVPDELELWKVVRVPAASVVPFANCLEQEFYKAHSVTTVAVRQRRQEGGIRVETRSASQGIQVRADVFDDGRAEFRDLRNAQLVDTSGERRAFLRCFDQHSPN